MSKGARAISLLKAWREGVDKPHCCHEWLSDDCDRCIAEKYDEWALIGQIADIMRWGPS